MSTSREIKGKTPNGGVRSVINFRDAEGNPVEESRAVAAEILEYDADGRNINRTYGTLGKGRIKNAR